MEEANGVSPWMLLTPILGAIQERNKETALRANLGDNFPNMPEDEREKLFNQIFVVPGLAIFTDPS